jgi:choline dehydrogenase-like flavoprotein
MAGVDVVVVGGGAAGCVVAARLAESGSRSVLLLEAGPDRRTQIPAALRDGWTIERESFEWGYVSAGEPPKPVRRKRVIGGTSWLTRFTPRGAPADYDGWAARGLHGWGWQDVLPYFVKLECDVDFGERQWHGDAGPMPSTRHLEHAFSEVTGGSVEALGACGFPWVEDQNEPGAVGAGRMPMNVRDGRRVTTADGYLAPEATPSNLTVRAGSLVDKVVFEGTTAVGVKLAEGAVLEAGWVVLCAGVYGSPTILLRSGIGRDGDLVDLPGVGENLGDHPSVYVDCGYGGPARAEPLLQVIATWHSEGRSTVETPDMMLWLGDPEGDLPAFEIGVVLLRPYSRGRVRLRSSNPVDSPVIELPNLADPADVTRLAEGYGRAIEVANHQALRGHCSGPAPSKPEELETYIRSELFSVPHTVGTCAMGSVVDASGNVFGVDRLTVADASIMPDVPSGFTHFPTIMIAERLAERVAA